MLFIRLFCCLLTVTSLAGCSPMVHHQGKKLEEEALTKVQPGRHNKQDVARLLGTPSTVGSFDDNKSYYISKVTETVAFFEPKVVEQMIVEVEFDENGIVKGVEQLDLADAEDVELVERITPTTGHSLSLMQQIFGNFGRFSRDDPKGPPA